jgi:hypothetical protein
LASSIFERRQEFDVVSCLYPNWLQGKEKFTNYFRIASESFNKFTGLVPQSVLKQNTITIWASRRHLTYALILKGKGKAVPLQAWSGPEGSRKLRFPDFMTTAQDGGKVVSFTHRLHLPPGNTPGTHFC